MKSAYSSTAVSFTFKLKTLVEIECITTFIIKIKKIQNTNYNLIDQLFLPIAI